MYITDYINCLEVTNLAILVAVESTGQAVGLDVRGQEEAVDCCQAPAVGDWSQTEPAVAAGWTPSLLYEKKGKCPVYHHCVLCNDFDQL